ncbi:MAG: phosphopeptide-binding protein [Pseudonocardiales bacterium]|nr:phosphopeptide-binding protein [Pseudonocardiales bacterium]
MMICPQGHQSATDDFCDVCGAPIDQGNQPAVPVPPPAPIPTASAPAAVPSLTNPSTTKVCPNCQTVNPVDALFCEDCGYDFSTGQLPPPPALMDPSSGLITAPVAAPASAPNLAGVDWVAEVWVDPDWFAAQGAEGSCPTGGLPTVVPLLGTSALIGRRSKSRNVAPEIDCTADGAISHSHAELVLANGRWSVKDLGSTNGTYVGRPDGTYPTDPLPARQLRELADDERVYLGAWTRIVVRQATDSERAGTIS